MSVKLWEVNRTVRRILALNWLDVDILLVNTVKNVVFIKGELKFKGRLVSTGNEDAVSGKLKNIEEEVLKIEGVEHLRWELEGWRFREDKWVNTTQT